MKTTKIGDREEYNNVMEQIEVLLKKSTQVSGSENLPTQDLDTLKQLSLMAEQYEDSISLMPIKKQATHSVDYF